MSCLHWSPPAGSRFCHSNGPDVFPSSHLWNIVLDLSLRAIVTDIRHYNLRMERKPRTSAVTVHSTTQKQPEHLIHYTHTNTQSQGKNLNTFRVVLHSKLKCILNSSSILNLNGGSKQNTRLELEFKFEIKEVELQLNWLKKML